jgi:hypothetical protein
MTSLARFALVAAVSILPLAGCGNKTADAKPNPAVKPAVAVAPRVVAPKEAVPSLSDSDMRSCDETEKKFYCTEYSHVQLQFYKGDRGPCPAAGKWSNAPCPTAGLFATCASKKRQTVTRYYLPHSEMYDFNEIKHDCEADADEGKHFTLQP